MNSTREREICNNCTVRWINRYLKPRDNVDQVEGFVIVAAVFMTVLAFGSPMRRQSHSIIIRYAVEGAFILSFPVLSYTMGLMQAEQIKSELFPVWAMFLAMLFGGTNAMSVLKLDQSKQLMKLYCDTALFNFYLGTVLIGFTRTIGKGKSYDDYVIWAVGSLLGLRNVAQWRAAMLANKPSSENGIKWLALHVKWEHQLSSTSYDPRTMQGYKYPVFIHLRRAVTLDEIWCDNIGVFSAHTSSALPPVRRLKDLCLSFALFHLVVRRHFGYTCPESKHEKTRALVLDGLLRTEQDYERAFQVIEAELGFVYGFFFTKYAFIMYSKKVWWWSLSLACTFLSIAAGTWSLSVLNTHSSILNNRLVETSARDVLVTKVALGVLSIFQLLEIWSYCVSDWAKVSLVCKYITRPSWQGNGLIQKLLLLQGRPPKWFRYWRNSIGQYSLLDSVSLSCWDKLKHLLSSGKVGNKPIELPMEVKRAVAWTIKNSATGRLSNGGSALARHEMRDQLSWACQIGERYTLAHSILVWHIATSYCEISETVRRPDEYDVHPNKVVATSLSKYCTYLVAFSPTLLPGSPIETECTIDELVKEAKETLQGLLTTGEKYEKLRELPIVARETMPATMLVWAVKLGKTLESMRNQKTRWDLLAEFWAEMLVYIAPSDNVAGHIELLAEGGEFLTHVWALLMHAGILERPPAAAAAAVP